MSRFRRWLRRVFNPNGYHYEYRSVKMRYFYDPEHPNTGPYWYQMACVKVPNRDMSCGWITNEDIKN